MDARATRNGSPSGDRSTSSASRRSASRASLPAPSDGVQSPEWDHQNRRRLRRLTADMTSPAQQKRYRSGGETPELTLPSTGSVGNDQSPIAKRLRKSSRSTPSPRRFSAPPPISPLALPEVKNGNRLSTGSSPLGAVQSSDKLMEVCETEKSRTRVGKLCRSPRACPDTGRFHMALRRSAFAPFKPPSLDNFKATKPRVTAAGGNTNCLQVPRVASVSVHTTPKASRKSTLHNAVSTPRINTRKRGLLDDVLSAPLMQKGARADTVAKELDKVARVVVETPATQNDKNSYDTPRRLETQCGSQNLTPTDASSDQKKLQISAPQRRRSHSRLQASSPEAQLLDQAFLSTSPALPRRLTDDASVFKSPLSPDCSPVLNKRRRFSK